jgi:hypothetical protein
MSQLLDCFIPLLFELTYIHALAGILEKKERDAIARTWQGKGFP